MTTTPYSDRIASVLSIITPLYKFETDSAWARRGNDPSICDFAYGNPHEMPLPGFVDALRRWSVPQNKDWFAYKGSVPTACAAVAESLRRQRGQPFEAEDVFMTNGAFAGIAVTLAAITNPGDEVIFNSPPWFFYEPMIVSYGAKPVRVKIEPRTFDLDLDAIAAAITERTRAIIVNSPNNPTGRIYPPETLEDLARLLTDASKRTGRAIYLISDESYNRIVYHGRAFHSPLSFYPNSFLIYTYGKTLLTPGQRLGYIALPPTMPNRKQFHAAILAAQLMTGHAFPNAVLQYAVPELENLSIDIAHLQRRRDRMVSELRRMGYDLHIPEGTFYLLVRSPLADDVAFTELLAEHKVFCMPGAVFEMPSYFRISLTANDGMIERALPGFSKAMEEARQAETLIR